MRPVDKGEAPRVYAKYRAAGADLQDRLGDYCSYCERQIETNLAVEHVRPKSSEASLLCSWSNFLLGCCNCNSCKGRKPVQLCDYLWPDTDNTLRAFVYAEGGCVSANPALAPELRAKAQATITLLGLDHNPENEKRRRGRRRTDKRWRRRREAWERAEKYRMRLRHNDTQSYREDILDVVLSRGMFSVWWTVFEGDRDMRRRLREAFLGTHSESFDANENLQARSGGQL